MTRWKSLLVLAGSLLAGATMTPGAYAAGRPPNVILIFSDDQGTIDINIYGAKDLYTPHLDALARRGTRFTQFYVAAPVCSPSRAALLTGRYPQRAGVPGNVGLGKRGMPAAQVTMAEMLKTAGYRTALVGKWHLGEVNGRGPLDQGFDSFYGHKRGCIDNYSHFFYWSGPNNHDLWRDDEEIWEDGHHFSDLMVREAKQFLDDNQDRPFFLYLPFNIPHYPLQGAPKWREHYKNLPSPRRDYAALVSTLDEKVGEILDHAGRLGLTENTLVIFLSDHGHSTEERTMFGGGNAGPYRGAKFSLFEGGIRVPAIVSLPGVIPENAVRHQFATSLDWLPTVAEITGAELPDRKIDGKSLMPVILSAEAKSPHKVFHWQRGKQWAVRDGNWKLIVNAQRTMRGPVGEDEKIFLSDFSKDTSERHNLAEDHPEVLSRLTKLHDKWIVEVLGQ